MTRFEQKPMPAIYMAIALSAVGILAVDLFTPLGIAEWVVYLLPVVLSLYVWRPLVPVAVAVLATAFIAIGYLTSAVGVDPWVAGINRGLGVVTIWVVAVIGYQFIRNKLAVRRQEWLQSGQTQLSERMGGDQQLPQFGENVLRFLSEYLDAHAAAFFIEDTGSFHRFASYAVPARAGIPERFGPGEGLLGQAVKDRRAFVARDVPEGYFAIGSGLGQSRPRHLVVSPVAVDGIVNGVLELGFIHPVYDSDLELLDRVSESIGVAIRSAKYRTRQQELLEETQRQAEELQAQSEELRVSNEELAEQSRALKESQTRLELQQAELEQTNAQLEEQTQLLEAQKDDLGRAKAALETQARDLEQASRYKSDFLANMSHELRTPLNSSLILAKLLADNREGNLTAEQVKYAQTIYSAGNDLLILITDILDLSKIEAGHMEARPELVPLSRLFENLARTFQPMAAQKGLQFRMHVAPGAPESLQTDPQRLEQVLRNLLSNAMKFTEKGQITLQVSRSGKGRLAFAVQDTGIGIPPDQQRMIFEPFRQADGTTNRKYGGTGLGLSISRELARLLGGEIILTSEVGRGSTFTVTVPEVYDITVAPPRMPDRHADPEFRTSPHVVQAPPLADSKERPASPCLFDAERSADRRRSRTSPGGQSHHPDRRG